MQTDRFTITSPPLQELFGAHSGFSDSPSPCSLVLIDRLEDIPTVLSALGPQSIAQRVLNTCRIAHDANPYRPSFDCKLDLSVQHPLFTSGSDNATSSLCQPRSALAGLPFKPPLSLCTSRALRPSVFVLPEDDGREKLISTLRGRIEGEGGTFVVKKRGVGAEMLALATALIESPGSEAERSRTWPQNLGFSPCVAVRRCSEISVALAYVEAMQRSAAKQFTGTYRAAYDVRAARESNMVQELFKTGPAGALTTLAHLYRSMDTHSQSSSALTGKGTTSGGPKSPTRKAPGKEAAKSEEDSGPVDLCHFLTLLAR